MNDCCLFIVFSLKLLMALIFLITEFFNAFVNVLIFHPYLSHHFAKFQLK